MFAILGILLLLALCVAVIVVSAKMRRDDCAARHQRVMRDIGAAVEVAPAKLQAPKPSAIVDHDEIWGHPRSGRSN